MRRTEKYIKALAKAREIKLRTRIPLERLENEQLYESLQDERWVWDHKEGEWAQIEPEEAEFRSNGKSEFVDREGQPTDIVLVRVMAHPSKVDDFVEELQRKGIQIGTISDQYANRKGAGVRVYLRCKKE